MNVLLYAAVIVASLALAIGRVQVLNRMIARQAAPAAPAPSAGESPDSSGTAGE
ncbi:MAG TPA: hypothetical protein VGG75_12835 [Trebonia sp.]